MSDITVIHNARLTQTQGQLSERYKITIADEKVILVEPMATTHDTARANLREDLDDTDASQSGAAKLIDVAGDWITLGAVDLQINGALGLAFPDLRTQSFERLEQICEFLWQQGIDSFCPTLVTTSVQNFQGALSAIQQFQQQQKNTPHTAKIIGAHLEGPFLNPAKRGAHPQQFLQQLSLENVKTLVGDFSDTISIMTLAPECATDDNDIIAWLIHQGITVSLGHSLATAAQASCAFDQGATMVTHAFNAMPGLHHRKPGMLGAGLTDSRVSSGVIADGQHICPSMLELLLRSERGRRHRAVSGLFLVSDALSPLGLPDGTYPWDEREITVVDGTARLANGTLSGTTLSLIRGAQNLVDWDLCEAEEAIALVTQAPRSAIGLTDNILHHRPERLLRWQSHADNSLTWQRLAV
ncbi:MAG: N-acetylglucosamine-6-phosphate deacetylase [Cyanobacteria bacterium P01_D01_bin.105]